MAAAYDISYRPTSASGKTQYSNYALHVSTNLLNSRSVDVTREDCFSDLSPSLTTKTIKSVSSSIPYYSNATTTYYYSSGVIKLVACPDGATWKAPTVDGYTFNGWYTIPSSAMSPSSDQGRMASNYTKLITSDADTTWGVIRKGCNYWGKKTDYGSNTYDYKYKNYIMLKYTPKTLTVRYNANRGSGAPSGSYTAAFDTEFTITSTKPTRSRYVFLGWSPDKNATTTEYVAGDIVLFPASLFNRQTEIVLYAVWQYGAVVVAFNPMGGTVSPRYLVLMKGGKYGTLPTAHHGDESSSSWYTEATGGTLVTANSTVPDNDHILYTHWSTTATLHTLTFDANGGTVSPSSKSLAEGAAYGSLPTPTRSGYTFVEWRTAPYVGTLVTAATTMGTDDLTIYAIWTGNPFTITLNPNGGTVSPTTKSVPNGSTYGILPRPTRSGYIFDGWWTAATGGTKILATVKPSGHQTVYAHWKQDGGEVVPWVF